MGGLTTGRRAVQYRLVPAARVGVPRAGRPGCGCASPDGVAVTNDTGQLQSLTARHFEPVRRRLRYLRLAGGCIAALGLFAAAVLLADGVERLVVLRESWVLDSVLLAAIVAVAILGRAGVLALLRGPSARDLALDIERARPEFMDSLVCAVELQERAAGAPNVLEQALLERVQGQLDRGSPLAAVFRDALRWRRLVVPAALFAACMALALHSRAWQKATARLGDLWRGQNSGLVLHLPAGPVPEHTDVRLDVEVRRWEPDASIEVSDAEGRHRFPMNRASGNRSFFTFYDVAQKVRFRVLTPSLASAWQELTTYRPPTFEEVSLRVEPPAYTGRETQVLDGFRDVHAVVGSHVAVRVRTQPGVAARWQEEDAAQPFVCTPDGVATYEFTVDRDATCRVVLRSPAGWEAQGPDVRLVAQPDLPPVVALLRPGRDVQAGKDDTVPLEVRAGDDFGLRRITLTYAISGGERQSVSLFAAEGERVLDQTVEHGLDLAALQVAPGDVITYTVSAADNREPVAQEARTEVCFIVVRPPREPEEPQCNQGQQMKLDISALIAESKRLIRLTWDACATPEAEREAMATDLHRDLGVLRLEIRKTFTKIVEEAAGLAVAGGLPELFGTAEREVENAVMLTERRQLNEAAAPQERALAALTRIENELLKNAAKGQGKGDSSQSPPPPQPPPAETQRSHEQMMQALRDARRQAQELAERQARLNQDMQRSPTLSPEAAQGLATKQRDLERDTGAVAQGLKDLPPAQSAADTLTAGAREMNQGAARLDQADSTTAERHGRRAGGLLDAAIKDLDDALRKAASDRIQALSQAATQMSDTQRRAAETSRELAAQAQPDSAAMSQAEKTQRELNQSAAELRQAVSRTAAEFEEAYPEASQALGEAVQSAGREGLERNMSRAANALLYRKPDKALKPQTDAANQLLEFANGLQAAGSKLPALSREELLEALQTMQQQAREAAESMQQPGEEGRQRLQAAQERAAQTLDPVAAALRDQALQEVADQLGAGIGEGPTSEVGPQSMRLFRAAISILERHVAAAEVRRRLDLSRKTALPPEKYRRQVEQYFRELGREP
jgi:hypothetical protein